MATFLLPLLGAIRRRDFQAARRLALCLAAACAIEVVCGGAARAQPAAPLSDVELSKEAENPLSYLITLPLRYQADFDEGPYDAVKSTFELDQAVLPFRLNDDWDLITRTKLPFESEPPKKLNDPWETGLSNGYTTFFLTPRQGDGIFWGAGPVLYYPTATNTAVGVNKWGAGPSFAMLKKDSSPWEWGIVVNNIWSFGGPPQGKDRTNSLLVNPFISYHFNNGWSLGTSPNVETDWLSKEGQQWTVPLGGGIAKVFRIGPQPMKLALDSYFNTVRPQAGSDTWVVTVTLTFLFSQ